MQQQYHTAKNIAGRCINPLYESPARKGQPAPEAVVFSPTKSLPCIHASARRALIDSGFLTVVRSGNDARAIFDIYQ